MGGCGSACAPRPGCSGCTGALPGGEGGPPPPAARSSAPTPSCRRCISPRWLFFLSTASGKRQGAPGRAPLRPPARLLFSPFSARWRGQPHYESSSFPRRLKPGCPSPDPRPRDLHLRPERKPVSSREHSPPPGNQKRPLSPAPFPRVRAFCLLCRRESFLQEMPAVA